MLANQKAALNKYNRLGTLGFIGLILLPIIGIGLAMLGGESGNKGLGGRRIEVMVPDRRPGPAQITITRRPGVGGIEIEADDRIRQPEFGILLDQVRDLIAGKIAADNVGLGLPQLQEIGAEVGDVGRNQFVADQVAIIGGEEGFGGPQQVVPEYIIENSL